MAIKYCTGDDCPLKYTCYKYIRALAEDNPGMDTEWIHHCDGESYEQKEFYGN